MHWDGARWTRSAGPAPKNADSSLGTVSASSASSAWAFGALSSSEGSFATTALHWDGTRWAAANIGSLSGCPGCVFGVSDISARDAWAVGQNNGKALFAHWNGRSWVIVRQGSQ
jgi:hypothetical protein